MARPLRIPYAGGLYHVTLRGNERRAIVRDDDDRERFVHDLGAERGFSRTLPACCTIESTA